MENPLLAAKLMGFSIPSSHPRIEYFYVISRQPRLTDFTNVLSLLLDCKLLEGKIYFLFTFCPLYHLAQCPVGSEHAVDSLSVRLVQLHRALNWGGVILALVLCCHRLRFLKTF